MNSTPGTCRVGKWSAHVQVNGAGQMGGALIILATKGEVFEVDDIFTIADVHDVQPLTQQSTGQRKRFMVTERMVAKGNGLDVLHFMPPIMGPSIHEPPKQYANVDALPANGAILEWIA